MTTNAPTDIDSEYIDTTDYKKMSKKLKDLKSVMDVLQTRNFDARKLRYTEIDIEVERGLGHIAPDEVYVPQHIIDSNIRREQASYVQYLTQSNRACILKDLDDPTVTPAPLEVDLTNKLRYDEWQIPMFANIDGFQQNGYSVIEQVFDQSKPGHLAREAVQLGDLGIPVDTKDIQESEIVSRNYYFSKTKLLEYAQPNNPKKFNLDQVKKVTESQPTSFDDSVTTSATDRSLYMVQKVMFRVKGVVHVAWSCEEKCDDWIRPPRPLFIGRMKAVEIPQMQGPLMPRTGPGPSGSLGINGLQTSPQVQWTEAFETQYPYVVFHYLISENNTINKLKGRAFLDQDTQTAVTSLLSSVCTAYRRASGFYASKDTDDPNADDVVQKNIFLKQGAIINSKIKQFQLAFPDPSSFQAIQSLVTANQSETAKVNFAANNRKDSRKTATEISASTQEAASLSTVQVVLFSTALKKLDTTAFYIIKSRVAAGLLIVNEILKAMYARNYSVRPAGDVDVIERQQLVQSMMQAWPVMQNTPAAPAFLSDMLMKMFPDNAPKYIQILMQAQQQAQSQQAQQQQQMMQTAMQMGKGLIELSKHPEMFSDTGKIHAMPVIEQAAQQLSNFIKPEQT